MSDGYRKTLWASFKLDTNNHVLDVIAIWPNTTKSNFFLRATKTTGNQL